MQKDFEVKKRARDERVAELEDQAQEIKAQLATTEHPYVLFAYLSLINYDRRCFCFHIFCLSSYFVSHFNP